VTSWYTRVVKDQNDLAPVIEACDFFEAQYALGVAEVDLTTLRGMRVVELQKRLPGIAGYRYGQLLEMNDIIGYLDLRETALMGAKRRHYLEHYERTLTATTVERYVESDAAVVELALLRNHVVHVRNMYSALMKQLDNLHFQLGDLTRLLVAGFNDAVI
jgi:hypothetical protein